MDFSIFRVLIRPIIHHFITNLLAWCSENLQTRQWQAVGRQRELSAHLPAFISLHSPSSLISFCFSSLSQSLIFSPQSLPFMQFVFILPSFPLIHFLHIPPPLMSWSLQIWVMISLSGDFTKQKMRAVKGKCVLETIEWRVFGQAI